jgi:hypothetical protein
VPIILELIRALATYERAPSEVTATEEQLVDVLFAERAGGGSAAHKPTKTITKGQSHRRTRSIIRCELVMSRSSDH